LELSAYIAQLEESDKKSKLIECKNLLMQKKHLSNNELFEDSI